jgi:3'-5' exonuclease
MDTTVRRMLVLDIETHPTRNRDEIERMRTDLKPPGNYKKPESIAEWFATQGRAAMDEAIARTALRGTSGEVTAIGYRFIDIDNLGHLMSVAFDSGPQVHVRALDESVPVFLRKVFEDTVYPPGFGIGSIVPDDAGRDYATPRWVVGHNLAQFDLPFLWQQFVRYAIPWPFYLPVLPSAYDDRVFDTMTGLVGARNTISLEDAARACGLNYDPASIPSAEVPYAWASGSHQLVADHLRNDIQVTGDLAIRLLMVRGGWQ